MNRATNSGKTITPLWVAECDMIMQGSAIAADIDGDGNAEFLTAAYQAVIAVDGKGREMWRVMTPWRYMTCPAVLEQPGELALIYAGDMRWGADKSVLSCIDGAGKVVWQGTCAPIYWATPALADIDGDGRFEVVQGDAAGVVHVWDALTGAIRWETQIDGECSSAAIGDLNGDGASEIVIATTTGKLFILSSAGAIVREKVLGGIIFDPVGEYANYRVCAPVIFPTSTGAIRIAASVQEPGSRRFLCLDAAGDVVWERETDGGIGPSVSVADFDGDGKTDIFAPSQTGRLYRWDEDGRALWDIAAQQYFFGPGAILDVNGDGALEYVAVTEIGWILVFDQAGAIIDSYQVDSRRSHRGTPAFGKVGGRLVFAVSGSDSGRMYCFGVPAPADTRTEWHTIRGDARLTGAWSGLARPDAVRMEPENLAWDRILTRDEVTFRVTVPKPGAEPFEAVASAVGPDGSLQGATGIIAGNRGVLKMPVATFAPGTYRFSWAVKDPSGARVAAGSRELVLEPWRNDAALARRTAIELGKAIGDAPVAAGDTGLRALLSREKEAIEREAADLALLQAAAPGASLDFVEKIAARTVALDERAKRAAALAKIAPAILASAQKCPVVAYSGKTWENRGVDREMPAEVAFPLRIARRCVTGEHEPVSVKLLNVTLGAAEVEVRVETASGGIRVTPHEVKAVATNPDQDTIAWDPVVPIKAGDRIGIPSYETREVWLDIDLADAKAGAQTVAVSFRAGGKETRVEIALDVLPFRMAGYDAMRLCTWAAYNSNAVADLLAHGNTVFLTGMPKATVSEDGGKPRVEVDFSALDAFVAPLAGHDVFLLLLGVPALGVDWQEDAYVPRLADYLAQVMAHLAAKGIPEKNVGLYTWDEVGGQGWDAVRRYVAFGKKALAARPGVKLYVNGGGDLPMFEELAEIAGIWSPAFYMLDDRTPVMDYLRKTDAAMWSYNCSYAYARPMGWNTKIINVVGEFRMQAVYAAIYGGTGIGYWCYNHGPSMWDPIHPEYPIVYHGKPDEPITDSRRWEAVRESIEDTRILAALKEKLGDPSTSAKAKAKIRHLVDVTLPAMAEKSLIEMDLGVARYVIDDTNDDAAVEAFREELLDCVAAVGK